MNNNPWRIQILGATLGILLAGTDAAAQATAAPARSPSSPPQAQAPARPAAPSGGGPRRDPFRPIIVDKPTGAGPLTCPSPGKAGLVIGQLTIQGIVSGLNGEWIAVVDNKTKRAYFLYEKDEVCNGIVARITEDSVVFEERVPGAAGRTQTREVVKQLAPN